MLFTKSAENTKPLLAQLLSHPVPVTRLHVHHIPFQLYAPPPPSLPFNFTAPLPSFPLLLSYWYPPLFQLYCPHPPSPLSIILGPLPPFQSYWASFFPFSHIGLLPFFSISLPPLSPSLLIILALTLPPFPVFQ